MLIDKTRHDALKNICKEKDKVINYYMNQCNTLKREMNTSKVKGAPNNIHYISKIDDLTNRLNKSQKLNEQLKKEISMLRKISAD